MDVNSRTDCLVEVDLVQVCSRAFTALMYAFAATIICVVFCAGAVVTQLRQNRVLAGADNKRNTALIANSISRTELLDDVKDYARDARANKDAAHDLVINARLGVPPAGSN